MATYISNQTGLWSSANTWLTAAAGTLSPTGSAGAAPVSFGGDKIIIRGGHTVTYDVSGCFGDETSTYSATGAILSTNGIVLSAATLKASRLYPTELSARGTIFIGASSTLDWGTSVDPLTTNANITLHYMSQLSALSASTGSAGIYLGGQNTENVSLYNNIYLNGKTRIRNTTLSVSAANGSNVISVVNATGWEVGNRLIIATELISNRASTTLGVLTAAYIQSLTGNNITISPALNTSRSAGTSVGNFSSNVNIKSYNPTYASYGIYLFLNCANIVDINNISVVGVGNGITAPTGWTSYAVNGVKQTTAQSGAPLGGITVYAVYAQIPAFTIKGISLDNPLNATQTYCIYFNGKYSEILSLEESSCFTPNTNGYFAFFNSQASTYIKNCEVYNGVYGILLGGSVPNYITIDNCKIDASVPLGNSLNGLSLNMINSKIRSTGYLNTLDALQKGTIKNSIITHTSNTGSIIQPNVNASGTLNFSNCYFYNGASSTLAPTLLSAVTKTTTGQGNKTAQTAEITLFQPNGSLFDYRRFNYYHYSQSDLNVRKRGITSYRIKPEVANTQFYNYFTLNGVISTEQRIKGSLRFDSTYGSSYPPSISFTGAGVNSSFTCTTAVDTWQDFDISFTPTTTDDITMRVTCQSTLTTGYVWLDGLPIYPYIQDVRHYGFIFDKSPDRTVNNLNTLTENQVSGLATVSNLDYLYDAASYWSVTNPASSSYIDLFTINGSILDFGSKNIVIASTPLTGFTYNSTLSTITINSDTLSAGINFTTLKTNGLVTLSGSSVLSNITVNANVSSLSTADMTGVTISKLLSYNTNSPVSIIYTNCAITSATNTGTANVTIKKINSTVTYV